LASDKLLLALEPLRQIGNGDAVGFAKTYRWEFPSVDCPADLFIVRANEFRGLVDRDRDWLDRRRLRNGDANPLE
jgi:hypothetical protein